ncbi:MAG: hypothetical protein IJO55_11985 [Lachnospiraceae bacterium]|nr:hypothetical protein [Lachnospiraceae bacterium]
MKRIKQFVTMMICFSLLMSFPGYASTLEWENVPGNHYESVILPPNVLNSKNAYRTVARGDFLSAGAVEIGNLQNGSLKINIDTYAHHNVDSIFHTVFLDQWDEDDQDWYQVGRWDFTVDKEEVENQQLSELLTIFTVTGYETGKYYRLRGLHGVEYNDEIEATATETNGVLLTDRS